MQIGLDGSDPGGKRNLFIFDDAYGQRIRLKKKPRQTGGTGEASGFHWGGTSDGRGISTITSKILAPTALNLEVNFSSHDQTSSSDASRIGNTKEGSLTLPSFLPVCVSTQQMLGAQAFSFWS